MLRQILLLLLIPLIVAACNDSYPCSSVDGDSDATETDAATDGDEEIDADASSDWVRIEHEALSFTDMDEIISDEQSLSGMWRLRIDADEQGNIEGWQDPATDISGWESAPVPGVWNLLREDLIHYKGLGWYATDFDSSLYDGHPYLEVGACFLHCTYWLNGEKLGESESGYLPQRFEVGGILRWKDNRILVRIDNRMNGQTIPAEVPSKPGTHGWWPYGGMHREVKLVDAGPVRLYWLDARPVLDGDSAKLTVRIGLQRVDESVDSVNIYAGAAGNGVEGVVLLDAKMTYWEAELPFDGNPWEPFVGKTKNLTIIIDTISYNTQIGLTTLSIDPQGLIVNGERQMLYGISRHEDEADTGSAQTQEDLDRDLALLQELGVNFIRVGHYPADPRWLRMLRDAGIMIVQEIPVYQLSGDQMADPVILEKAKAQLSAMIERDRNNPAIVAWSLMNEVFSTAESSGPFAEKLAAHARELDPTRPLFLAEMAMPTLLSPVDYVAEHVDIVGLNNYHGWYFGSVEGASEDTAAMMARHPDKALVVSEFGAGAAYGRHLPEGEEAGPEPRDDHSYTEEFQAWFLDQHMQQYRDLPVAGVMPWAFADFKMEWTTPTGELPETFKNFKGLLSQTREKKLAFDVIKDWYTNRRLEESL